MHNSAAHKREPLRKGISRNDAKGRFSFSQIVDRLRLRQGFKSMQYKYFPTSHTCKGSHRGEEILNQRKTGSGPTDN